MYYLHEKYCEIVIVQYYIADCVSWAPRLILLDSQMCSWNWTPSYVGDLLCIHTFFYLNIIFHYGLS